MTLDVRVGGRELVGASGVTDAWESDSSGPIGETLGESGTFAVTRPDIATQVRFRKERELHQGMAELRDHGNTGPVKILTSCPSCLQGLARYQDDVELDADYIVVELAKYTRGPDWLASYVRAANQGGIKRVLV